MAAAAMVAEQAEREGAQDLARSSRKSSWWLNPFVRAGQVMEEVSVREGRGLCSVG